MDQYDREEEGLLREYNEDRISLETYNREVRELQRDCRDAAREATQDAYDRELERW